METGPDSGQFKVPSETSSPSEQQAPDMPAPEQAAPENQTPSSASVQAPQGQSEQQYRGSPEATPKASEKQERSSESLTGPLLVAQKNEIPQMPDASPGEPYGDDSVMPPAGPDGYGDQNLEQTIVAGLTDVPGGRTTKTEDLASNVENRTAGMAKAHQALHNNTLS